MSKKIEGHKGNVTVNGKGLKGCFDYTCHIRNYLLERYDGSGVDNRSGEITLSCFTHEYKNGDRLVLGEMIDLVLTDWVGQSLSYKTELTAATQFENVAEAPRIVYNLDILTNEQRPRLELKSKGEGNVNTNNKQSEI